MSDFKVDLILRTDRHNPQYHHYGRSNVTSSEPTPEILIPYYRNLSISTAPLIGVVVGFINTMHCVWWTIHCIDLCNHFYWCRRTSMTHKWFRAFIQTLVRHVILPLLKRLLVACIQSSPAILAFACVQSSALFFVSRFSLLAFFDSWAFKVRLCYNLPTCQRLVRIQPLVDQLLLKTSPFLVLIQAWVATG